MSGLREQLRATARRTVSGAGALAWVGFAVGGGFVGLVVLMVAGETITDPGGVRALGLTAAWLLPLLAVAALALLRPSAAVPTLAVLALLPVGFGLWALVDYDGARGWEDSNGPVSLVLIVVVAAGLLVLGLSRPTAAGVLLLVVTLVPAVLAVVGAGSAWFEPLSIALVSAPIAAAGVLFLVAGSRRPVGMAAPQPPPRSRTP